MLNNGNATTTDMHNADSQGNTGDARTRNNTGNDRPKRIRRDAGLHDMATRTVHGPELHLRRIHNSIWPMGNNHRHSIRLATCPGIHQLTRDPCPGPH